MPPDSLLSFLCSSVVSSLPTQARKSQPQPAWRLVPLIPALRGRAWLFSVGTEEAELSTSVASFLFPLSPCVCSTQDLQQVKVSLLPQSYTSSLQAPSLSVYLPPLPFHSSSSCPKCKEVRLNFLNPDSLTLNPALIQTLSPYKDISGRLAISDLANLNSVMSDLLLGTPHHSHHLFPLFGPHPLHRRASSILSFWPLPHCLWRSSHPQSLTN